MRTDAGWTVHSHLRMSGSWSVLRTGRRLPAAVAADLHWVYGRARRPCLRCGTPIAFAPAERTPHGRETWWCPRCQPG